MTASGYDLNPRSGMISLDLPKGTIKPAPGGVDDHHVTVVYLGPDVDDQAFAQACQRAKAAAAVMPDVLAATVGGIDSFPPSPSSDGKVPAFAPVNMPAALPLRSKLADLSASEHKDWKPHVTMAYVGEKDPLPAPVPRTKVRFTHLSVHRGGDVKRFPLGGTAEPSSVRLAVELSAQTARLAATPSPWGSPAGPGLWKHKGWALPNYVEQVSKGIMKSGRARDESEAIHLALGVLARWARGGGKVRPEVRAAAAKAIAEFQALKARAAASHSHSVQGLPAVELASAVLPDQPRVEPGQPEGGQYDTRPVFLSRTAFPDEIAAAVARMGPQQREAYRAVTLAPPGFYWSDSGHLKAVRPAQAPSARSSA